MKTKTILLVLVLLTSLAVFRTTPLVAQQESGAPDAATSPAHPLAWLEGRWKGQGFGGIVEEAWMPPRGGEMLGMFRLVKGEQPSFYELITIVEGPEGRFMRLKHFHPNLASWEPKEECLTWEQTVDEPEHIGFGPVQYELVAPDKIRVYVELGEGQSEEYVMERAN